MSPRPSADAQEFRHPRGQLTGYLAGAAAAGLAAGLLVYRLAALQRGDVWPQDDSPSVWPIVALRVLAFVVFLLFAWLGYLGVAGLVHNLLVSYRIEDTRIGKRYGRRSEEVPWSRISSFSETGPTHREGDQFCYLKERDGEVLMRVGAHVLGDDGPPLLEAIRQHIGPPRLDREGPPEVFAFGDFGETPPFHVELTFAEVAAVSSVGEMRMAFHEIDRIHIRAWPETGMGMERARILAADRMIELDSRMIGFWPLVDYLVERAPDAEVEDKSRRARLAGARPASATDAAADSGPSA